MQDCLLHYRTRIDLYQRVMSTYWCTPRDRVAALSTAGFAESKYLLNKLNTQIIRNKLLARHVRKHGIYLIPMHIVFNPPGMFCHMRQETYHMLHHRFTVDDDALVFFMGATAQVGY